MKRPDIIIGIDPDVESSGIAALNCNTRSVKIGRKKFPELIESLKDLSDSCKEKGIPLLVVVEASWLISHNWHAGTIKGTRAIAKTGYNVGKNLQVGILIVEYCKSIGLDIKEQMPLKMLLILICTIKCLIKKKTKWLIYTVIIGLIPFLIRSIICLFDNTSTISYWINETDFIVFGLVLNLSNINELEDKEFKDHLWKTKNIGFSIVQIIFFSSILAIVTYSNFKSITDLNILTVKICSIILAVISFIFSYSIFNRLNTIASHE